jgi:UDP-N-acetylglucosamine enolpyruvyl transferase
MTLSVNLNVGDSTTLKIHSQDFPSLPTDLSRQILVVNNSGDGLEWIKSDSIGGDSGD